MTWTAIEILNELIELEEHQRIEAKRANAIGSSVMQTVCAFANEPGLGGGWLLLGIAEPDAEHENYWVVGLDNIDKLLNELQNNSRNQFDHPVHIECKHEKIDGKSIIVVYVHELEPSAKPCRFIGKPDKHNKRKTGVWRRGANGDYECTEKELEPILIAKAGISYEQIILPDATLDDLDETTIEMYRKLRAKVRPNAEELQADDLNLLKALHVVKKQGSDYIPNIAGLLLFGKTLSLKGLLPAMRVDYVRIAGTQWVEDPEQRFQYTHDLREPLIRLIPKLENVILDDMPYHFRLEEGELQRSDQPLLPQKVIREAIVNAVMHRDYHINQPTIIARYRNRLEIRNAGYSLKPIEELNDMNSVLRNPIIANVLYDLDFAETKGTGFRTMQRLLHNAGLTKPILVSNRHSNHFTVTFLLHQLMNEEQLIWLQQFKHFDLSNDEAKALVLVKEIGAIDNAALRAITDLDTLSASQLLSRLSQQHSLLIKGGSGRSTYYEPSDLLLHDSPTVQTNEGSPEANRGDLEANRGDLEANRGDLEANRGDLPPSLQNKINNLTSKARTSIIRPLILELCEIRPYSADEIASTLNRDVKSIKFKHLTALREAGLLAYLYSEVVNHPNQAYTTTDKGKKWLRDHFSLSLKDR